MSTSASLAFGRQGMKVRGFDFSGEVAGFGAEGGGGAGRFMLGEGVASLTGWLGAMEARGEELEVTESGERHTGSRSLCSTEPDWRTGDEMSRVLRLLRSGRDLRGREPSLPLVLLELFSLTDGVRLTLEMSLEKVDFSEESVESFASLEFS